MQEQLQEVAPSKDTFTIKEVAERTSLAESTLRYYEDQFKESLSVKRDSAKRRVYTEDNIKQILYIRSLVKKDGMSVKQAKERLRVEGELLNNTSHNESEAKIKILMERVARLETQQDLLVKGSENILKVVRDLERKLDLNMSSLSILISRSK